MAIDASIPLQTQLPQIQGPAQLMAQKMAIEQARQALASGQQEQQLNTQKLRLNQREIAQPAVLSKVIASTPEVDLGGGIKGYDVNAISKGLAAQGYDPGVVAQHLSAINDATINAHMSRLNLVRLGAQGVAGAGYDPTLATSFINTSLRPLIGDQDADQYIAQIKKDPGFTQKLVDSYLLPEQKTALANAQTAQINAATKGRFAQMAGILPTGTASQGTAVTAGGSVPAGTLPAPSSSAPSAPSAQSAATTTGNAPTMPSGGSNPLLNTIDRMAPASSKLLGDLNGPFRERMQIAMLSGPEAVDGVLKDLTTEVANRGGQVNPAIINAAVSKAVRTAVGTQKGIERIPIYQPSWASDGTPPTGPDAGKVDPQLGLSHQGVYQAALNAIQNHEELPSLGLSSSPRQVAQRTAIINMVGAILAHAGKDLPEVSGALKSDQATLDRLAPIHAATVGSETAANNFGKLLLQASAKVPRTSSPLVNRYDLWVKDNLAGQPNVSAFELAAYSYAREYARVTSGAAASVEQINLNASKMADQLINTAKNHGQLQAIVDQGAKDMNGYSQGQEQALNATFQHMRDVYTKATNGTVTTAPNPNTPPAALRGAKPGTYHLSDGSTWKVDANGATKVQP